jgi:HipA-like C-terminal domain
MLMLQLAREAGLSAAEGAVCEWLDEGKSKRGLAVRSFVDRSREQLVDGTILLSRHDAQYEPESKWQHSLDRVREVLAHHESSGGRNLLVGFCHLLAFDAWIGNGDRHQGNWSMLFPEDGHVCWLAPMYDPAACLGTELQDAHRQLDPRRRTEEDLDTYIKRCPSGFGDGTHPIRLVQVVEIARQWPEWQNNAGSWVAAFRNAFNTLKGVLPSVESSWLPDPRKSFVTTLLERRLNWLERWL